VSNTKDVAARRQGSSSQPASALPPDAGSAISERKRADDRFIRFLEAAPDAIVSANRLGTIVLVNAQTETMFGYARIELLGQPFEKLVAERFRAKHAHHRAEFFAASKAASMASGLELHGLRKDGSEFPIELSSSPLETEEGLLAFATIRDITDRKRAEEALARAKDAAEIANRELESFSYSVAHNLRAPLRGIDGFSKLLLEDYGEEIDAEGKRCLDRIRESAQHMAQLIESLLTLAHVTQSELRRERVDLSQLARASAERLQRAEPEREVELTIADGLIERGDSRLLGVVFDHLLGNAWKFTREQPQARIDFGCTQEDRRNVYVVRDNGAGFDMAFAPKLFDVFQRLHTRTEFDGTGIGLAIVQRIIRRHGGRIWAEGQVAAGAAFYFALTREAGE
jgi:PAS domain S-box-containing protein